MKSAAPGRQSWGAYSRGGRGGQQDSRTPGFWPPLQRLRLVPPLRGRGNPDHGFWHTGQKKVDRPDWTMRLIIPLQPGVWQGSFSRS
jgi:hypothetical protein